MPVIHPDIIEGNVGRLGINGWEFDRIFTVSELETAGWNMLVEATLASGMPVMNDPHPSIINAYVVDFATESLSGNTVKVTVIYRQFTENYLVSIGSNIVTREVTDYLTDQTTGTTAPMKLEYTYPAGHILEGKTDNQGAMAAVRFHFPQFTVSRTEWLTRAADALSGHAIGIQLTGNILSDRGDIYNNSLNKANWFVKSGDPEGSWQCVINANSLGNGFDWRVNYTFTKDTLLWNFIPTYKDPTNNEPVPDPVETVAPTLGSKTAFPQYRVEDFNLLGIQ